MVIRFLGHGKDQVLAEWFQHEHIGRDADIMDPTDAQSGPMQHQSRSLRGESQLLRLIFRHHGL